MRSSLPKVMHPICGRPMLGWVMDAVQRIDSCPIVIVGNRREQVIPYLEGKADIAIQEEQKGTGHAVMTAQHLLPETGYTLVVAGDMPLLTAQTLEQLVETAAEYDAVVLTCHVEDPSGYGRIIRNAQQKVTAIVEDRDLEPAQRSIQEINTSVYCFKTDKLRKALEQIGCDNAQGEYYLTDAIGILAQTGKVGSLICDAVQAMGVNDQAQLAQAAAQLRRRINAEWMKKGVCMIDPERVYIDHDVTIGEGTCIYPGNVLTQASRIGAGCTLYPNNEITDSVVEDGCTVRSSVLLSACVGRDTTVGPYAYLRPKAQVGEHCRIGDFVEIKNATIGNGTKVSHLTYVGDADVGQRVNVGCGVVFVNYDGHDKHRSQVGDDVFIGCNTNLVAPVQVGAGAYTAAGSTITQDIPQDALAIARAQQVNKPEWAARRRAKYQEKRK